VVGVAVAARICKLRSFVAKGAPQDDKYFTGEQSTRELYEETSSLLRRVGNLTSKYSHARVWNFRAEGGECLKWPVREKLEGPEP
jgi:hypothetical protein